MNSVPGLSRGKPIRTALRWQLAATAASITLAGLVWGRHGAFSALAGGLVNVTAGAVFGWIAVPRGRETPKGAMVALLRAEAVRIALIVAQLWIVLAAYERLLALPFFATFALTVILFSLALFVRDT